MSTLGQAPDRTAPLPTGPARPVSPGGWARKKAVAAYVLTAALSLLLAGGFLQLWQADLDIPFGYEGDGLVTLALVKGLQENGWYLDNARVGAPAGLDMRDFPMADTLHFGFLKLLGMICSPGAACNVYFLLTFPLTAVTALFALRRFGVSHGPAVLSSLLYALLPCHFFRGPGHLFLASYYLVPLMNLVVLRVYLGPVPFFRHDEATGEVRWWPLSWQTAGHVGVCLLAASAGIYYAFFGCYLLLVAAAASCLGRKRLYPLLSAGVLLAVLIAGVLGNVAPSLCSRFQRGSNPQTAHRGKGEADLFGMKMAQLLLPVTGHPVRKLMVLKDRYNRYVPPLTEAHCSTLGLIGGAGFIFLLLRMLGHRKASHTSLRVPDGLARLTLFAVLLGTVGGFGSLFSVLVNPSVRCYNRISVYIAFFSLFAVAWALDRLAGTRLDTPRKRWAFRGLCGLLLLGGAFDQWSRFYAPPYEQFAARYHAEAAFVAHIEASLPAGAMVFQLPYRPFPECPPTVRSHDYEMLHGYVHSRGLRWSYGTMRGRPGDAWLRTVAALPCEEFVRRLAFAGFAGIYVDRHGYRDNGAELEASLARLLDREPAVSGDQRYTFFDLTGYVKGLKQEYTDEGWAAQRAMALHVLGRR